MINKIRKMTIWLFVFIFAAGMFPADSLAGEAGDKANSFRYSNGKLMTGATGDSESTGSADSAGRSDNSEGLLTAGVFAISENAWKKVNGKYYNSSGQVIEGATARGIDVSHNQGTIDWKKVKADGVDFAIIRCGYGMDQTDQDDAQWENNIKGCEENGIPYGVYIYSYADTTAKASSEADHVLRLIKQCNSTYFKYPVYYDMEDTSVLNKTSTAQLGEIASTFLTKVKSAGYQVGVFSSKNGFEKYLTASVFNKYNRWVAHWSSYCGYTGTYKMWQATSTGTVDGISGNVDIDFVVNKTSGSGKVSTTPTAKKKSTQKTVSLKTPSIKVKKAGKKKVKVTWKPKTAGAKCYIYYSKKKKSGYRKYAVVSAKKGKITVKKKLKSGKKYYFKVRISKKVNGRMIYSKYSAVRAVKVK